MWMTGRQNERIGECGDLLVIDASRGVCDEDYHLVAPTGIDRDGHTQVFCFALIRHEVCPRVCNIVDLRTSVMSHSALPASCGSWKRQKKWHPISIRRLSWQMTHYRPTEY